MDFQAESRASDQTRKRKADDDLNHSTEATAVEENHTLTPSKQPKIKVTSESASESPMSGADTTTTTSTASLSSTAAAPPINDSASGLSGQSHDNGSMRTHHVSFINDAISLANTAKSDPWVVPIRPDFHINPPPRDRPVRIYCDGIYDLFHFGHARALEQAKKYFPNVYLMVGVCSDYDTHTRKGKTLMNESERAESIRHCRWVDQVIENAPWFVTQEFIDRHKIDYVAHDAAPYDSVEEEDVYGFVKQQGKFLPTERTTGVSTSDLITRIVRDYDRYLRRNLERGISAKELNISRFKEQELRMKKSVEEIRDSIRQNWQGTREDIQNELDEFKMEVRHTFAYWKHKRQDLIRGFTKLFVGGGVVRKLLGRSESSTSLDSAAYGASPTPSGLAASERSPSPVISNVEDE